MTKNKLELGLKDLNKLEQNIDSYLQSQVTKKVDKVKKEFGTVSDSYIKSLDNILYGFESPIHGKILDAKFNLRNFSETKVSPEKLFPNDLKDYDSINSKLTDNKLISILSAGFKSRLIDEIYYLDSHLFFSHELPSLNLTLNTYIDTVVNTTVSKNVKLDSSDISKFKSYLSFVSTNLKKSISSSLGVVKSNLIRRNKGVSYSVVKFYDLNSKVFESQESLGLSFPDEKKLSIKEFKKALNENLSIHAKFAKKVARTFDSFNLSDENFTAIAGNMFHLKDDYSSFSKDLNRFVKRVDKISESAFESDKLKSLYLENSYLLRSANPYFSSSVNSFNLIDKLVSLYDSVSEINEVLDSSFELKHLSDRYNVVTNYFKNKKVIKKALKKDLGGFSFEEVYSHFEKNPEEFKHVYSSKFKAKKGVESVHDLKEQALYGVLVVGARLLNGRMDTENFLDKFSRDYSQSVKPPKFRTQSRSPSFGKHS